MGIRKKGRGEKKREKNKGKIIKGTLLMLNTKGNYQVTSIISRVLIVPLKMLSASLQQMKNGYVYFKND